MSAVRKPIPTCVDDMRYSGFPAVLSETAATKGVVLGATLGFAAVISIGYLNLTTLFVLGVAFGHGLHLFLLNQPSRWVANAQLPLQGRCGQAGFGLADQVDRQEPDRQRQVSALEQSAGNQRSLEPKGLALKCLAGANVK